MSTFRNSDRYQHSYRQKNNSNNFQRDQWRNIPMKDIQDRIQDVETRLHVLESKYQDMHHTTAADLEEMKKRLDLIEGNLAKKASNKFGNLQHMDLSELKELGSVIDELKNAIDYCKDLKTPTQNVDEKGESNGNSESILINITPHSDFILDEENRAIVYVKSKIFGSGKQRKGVFGIWWSAGHKGNTSRVIEDVTTMYEDDINLHAFICAMETAIRYKMQRLCVISDSKYVINKMTDSQSEKNKKQDSQWKVLSTHPADQENLFHYAYDMVTWFYDIKWSYIDEPSKLPGMMDASKLIEKVQSK